MRRNALEVLGEFFGVDEEQATALLVLTQWVDQELAIEEFGYAKDNLMPPAMEERLGDVAYLRRLLEAAEDQDPGLVAVIEGKIQD